MENSVIIAICMVLALWVMIPKRIWRWLAGYTLLVDLLASAYVIHTGVKTGTVTGMTAGFIAALFLTLTIRGMRYVYGSERIALDGSTSISKIVAGVATQGVRWIRAVVGGLFTGSEVKAPEPMNWSWVEVSPAHGLRDIINILGDILRPVAEAL